MFTDAAQAIIDAATTATRYIALNPELSLALVAAVAGLVLWLVGKRRR